MTKSKPTLFLDMDGVLNCTWTFVDRSKELTGLSKTIIPCPPDPVDPKLIANLNLVTSAFPNGIDIVISSTWRKNYKPAKMSEILQREGLRNFTVIGATPVLHQRRGIEIREWLLDNPEVNAGNWCIVDDDSDMLPLQLPRFVKTTFDDGLTVERAQAIINIFKQNERKISR